jgi:hypothetical protein
MTEPDNQKRDLKRWTQRLTQALQLLDLEVDQDKVLELAKQTSAMAGGSAGPISTFIAGYAAGQSASSGKASGEAVSSALDMALRVSQDGTDGGQDKKGWAGTAQ